MKYLDIGGHVKTVNYGEGEDDVHVWINSTGPLSLSHHQRQDGGSG